MHINYKQSQFELFPETVGPADKNVHPRLMFSSLIFSLENIIVTGIFIVMAVILSFSVGVERGKRTIIVPAVTTSAPGTALAASVSALPANQGSVAPKVAAPAPPAIEKKTDKFREEPAKLPEILTGDYTVQVASFKKKDYAMKEATDLKKNGYHIFIVTKSGYSLVCVGKFSEKDGAKVILTQLKKKYKDCMVRRL